MHKPETKQYRVSGMLPKVKFLLAIVAPISVQIIVQHIELLTTRYTILTIAILVDGLRHITKRSTTLKNNLIVILSPKDKSAICDSANETRRANCALLSFVGAS
jgi:hypothetical protein